ncbi:MAG: hypothetical protein QOD39_781 [Mycobacterium sp.]|nr:hypothetical protein [Mycobacterium sp.]
MVGYLQITVQGSGFHHATMIPATSPQSVMRSLAAAA